jgi:hypothetical protein
MLQRKRNAMKDLISKNLAVVIGAIWLSTAIPLCATTIYDNSVNALGMQFNPGTLQVGNEIVLAGTARYLTNFSFGYWGISTAGGAFAGTVECRVKFYLNEIGRASCRERV